MGHSQPKGRVNSRETNICHHEITRVPPSSHEDGEAIKETHDAEEDHRGPGYVRLEARAEPCVFMGAALHDLRLAKADVCPANGHPR